MAEKIARRALVLASGSRTRFEIMKSAGLSFTVDPADIDEPAIRAQLMAQNPPAGPNDMAAKLASAKALAISPSHGNEIVIGSDQILSKGTAIFEKPSDRDKAMQELMSLRGCAHTLHTGVALACEGKIVWRHVETAVLTMREFSKEFAADYLRRIGDDACLSVGAYQIEGPGIQLFEKIDGDYFTILGLPLLPLLQELRRMGELDK